MQYWATSACCLGVVLLLCMLISDAPSNMPPRGLHSALHAKFSLSCIGLYTTLCCVSLGAISLTGEYLFLNYNYCQSFLHPLFCFFLFCFVILFFFFLFFSFWACVKFNISLLTWLFTHSFTGFNTVLKLFWMLCHGLAAVKLIQHLLNTFPLCASIGMYRKKKDGLIIPCFYMISSARLIICPFLFFNLIYLYIIFYFKLFHQLHNTFEVSKLNSSALSPLIDFLHKPFFFFMEYIFFFV